MAERRHDEPHGITVYGNGAYYADQAGDASRYSATRDGRIARAEFVCPADHQLDVDDLIIQHALPVQELARRHLSYLQIEMLPGSIGEPVDEALIADILETASGWHLLRAINGACHGYPVGEGGTEVDEGFSPRVAASREVQQVLSSAGIRAIRFTDTADGYGSNELGPFYFIVDRTVLQPVRLDAHFSLQFADYATADEAEAARSLNREWRLADDAGRDVVRAVVGLCRRGGAHTTLPFGEGGAYHRLVIIEDTPEIQCASANCLIMQTSEHFDMRRALAVTMRRRPDRIIVGEVRGGEARTLIEAWNTGHAGGIATVHANDARAGLRRLEMLCAIGGAPGMAEAIGHAVNLLVFIAPVSGGRRIEEILHVDGYVAGTYQLRSAEMSHG